MDTVARQVRVVAGSDVNMAQERAEKISATLRNYYAPGAVG